MAIEKLLDDPSRFGSLREEVPYVSRNLGSMDETFSADMAQRLLFDRGLRAPYVRMRRGDEEIPVRGDSQRRAPAANDIRSQLAGLADPHHVMSQLQAGATVFLQALPAYCPEVASFCAELAAEIGCPVEAYAFLTPPHSRGLPLHYDLTGVFVRQLAGAKTWRVYAPPKRWPVRRSAPGVTPETPLVLEVTLGPGDCLYLPRGYYHQGATGDLGSVHMTLTDGVEDTWNQVLQDVLALAVEQVESLRARLPDTRAALSGEAKEQWKDIRADLIRFLEDIEEEKVAALIVRRLRARESGARPAADALARILALGAHAPHE